MFYHRNDSEDVGPGGQGDSFPSRGSDRIPDSRFEGELVLEGPEEDGDGNVVQSGSSTSPASGFSPDLGWKHYNGYERELIQSVWEFAEIIPGNDAALWRKDEYGDWIYRLDYGRRNSEFGWEIFDPGVGRHAQGVYAMRPMQWQSYIRQYETFS
ncbi:MAG: hypothetical protein KBF76_16090 [Verrucomicrobiales bacterium]|jgi:hypothetical protein|nr:hypothetical protein [Verrucomicrobiales bacterium]HQZ27098.1 hypothetical protein [Verrucomicrobiales bacterium]